MFFYVFYVFSWKSKNVTFYVLSFASHVFSNYGGTNTSFHRTIFLLLTRSLNTDAGQVIVSTFHITS